MDNPIYQGSCHCGAVQFEVSMPAPAQAFACNCSICSRAGWLLAFVDRESVRVLTGEESLEDYQFGKKSLHHLFCRTCGIHPFSRGTDPNGKATVALNLRCLEGLDVGTLPVQIFDGKSL